jgi:hypothetical protein
MEKISIDVVKVEGISPMGLKYHTKRPLNNFEQEVKDKINELVDKFNEVFPL